MPSDKPDEVRKWRHPVSAVQTISATAFAEMLLENGMRAVGPYDGYLYAALQTDDGFDMFRVAHTPRVFYTARRVATQANGGGGAVIIDVTCAAGQMMRLISASMANSGTNTCAIIVYDEDNASTCQYAYVGSAATTSCRLPSIGSAATASSNIANSQDLIVLPGQKLSFAQSGAGAQNDTITVAVVFELIGTDDEPTWSVARSTNAGSVTLAASTISAANTLVTVVDAR